MKKRSIACRVFSVFLIAIFLYSVHLPAAYCKPAEMEVKTEKLLGLYRNGDEDFWIRERDGILELLYKVKSEKAEVSNTYVMLPLKKVSDDSYLLVDDSPLGKRQAPVTFRRNASGQGTVCYVGKKSYTRHFYETEEGVSFRITSLLPETELRQRAASGIPPTEIGVFRQSDLVEIVKLDPNIRLDIRYATANNFMGMPLYAEPRAFLQRPAAQAVVRVHQQLEKYGYGLIVYDAYRPWYVTKMFWDATPDHQKVFFADPSKGSRHNRGGAVDIGLYNRKTGQVVSMTSGYDEFSPRAYSDFLGGSSAQRWHRDLLRVLMEGEGFTVYPEEWWHFDYNGWKEYPILNLDFNKIPN